MGIHFSHSFRVRKGLGDQQCNGFQPGKPEISNEGCFPLVFVNIKELTDQTCTHDKPSHANNGRVSLLWAGIFMHRAS
jgi:hypothetical protein